MALFAPWISTQTASRSGMRQEKERLVSRAAQSIGSIRQMLKKMEWLAVQVCCCRPIIQPTNSKEKTVSKSASTSSVYRVTELIGTSESSWEDAAKQAVETATKTLRDLRVAEVNKLDLVIVDGKVTAFRARVSLSFKYEGKE